MSKPRLLTCCSLLFFLSGITGLIYESIWAQYLKLLLGHAAYAQLLVLVVFMGGMALGASICARYSHKIKNLFKAYAITELFLGLYGIFFHALFTSIQSLLQENILSTIQSPSIVTAVLWVTGTLLILPQSILLGATFPLMTSAVLRLVPQKGGRLMAWLYFVNTIGGAVGVLLSGFILVDCLGLPGTMFSTGIMNGLIALCVLSMAIPAQPIKIASIKNKLFLYAPMAILFYAALTGFASFLYQIAWVRMLSMVLGSSTHAFELMLSAFIAGLAMGSLYVYKIINSLQYPLRNLAHIQILMGAMALSTLPLYNISFEVFCFFKMIPKTNDGYHLFNVLTHGFCFLFMLPTTFCAGMTLPILTKILLDKNHGEKSIGQVYASNTLGAIMGAVLAQQWLMPFFGLKIVIGLGGAVDILLGFFILFSVLKNIRNIYFLMLSFFTALYAFGILNFVQLNKTKMASNVFRFHYIIPDEKADVLFHKDGKTATVSVLKISDAMTINTNGKTDASISLSGNFLESDEKTQVMLAIFPWSLLPKAQKVAVIGFGSGMTTHTFLNIPSINQVDTLEIEPAVLEGSKWFGESVKKAFFDERSTVFIEDARAFFARTKNQYDIIVSEPSNPWVSGVSNLFTKEFYAQIKKNIAPGGVFAQWIHLYDISPHLIATIFNTIGAHFENYTVFFINDHDLLIIASDKNLLEKPSSEVFSNMETGEILRRFSIRNMDDLLLHKIANRKPLESFLKTFSLKINSDYFPILDLNVSKSMFLSENFFGLMALKNSMLVQPFLNNSIDMTKISQDEFFPPARQANKARHLYNKYVLNKSPEYFDHHAQAFLRFVENKHAQCQETFSEDAWIFFLRNIMESVIPYLSVEQRKNFWEKIKPVEAVVNQSLRLALWIKLYSDLIDENYHHLLASASEILNQKESPENHATALTLKLFAHLQLGTAIDAKKDLKDYPAQDDESLPLRFLRTQVMQS